MASREPERTCIGCRKRSPKAELVRICFARGSQPQVDFSGGAPGRGAYVHAACAAKAFESGAVARALRVSLEPGEAATLRELIEGTDKR